LSVADATAASMPRTVCLMGHSRPERGNGYWLLGGDGGVFAFDAPFLCSAA
jgi:hypothetical protein